MSLHSRECRGVEQHDYPKGAGVIRSATISLSAAAPTSPFDAAMQNDADSGELAFCQFAIAFAGRSQSERFSRSERTFPNLGIEFELYETQTAKISV